MYKTIGILFFVFLCFVSKAQVIFYQNNIKGGVTGDGRSHYSIQDYMAADTIALANVVPTGATIKKAFLFWSRGPFFVGGTALKDDTINVKLNNNVLKFDSADVVTNEFKCINSSHSGKVAILAKDVSQYVLSNNNVLIVPDQAVLMANDNKRRLVYRSIYLLIIYEDNIGSNTNVCIVLNTKDGAVSATDYFSGLNEIDITKDVGFSHYFTSATGGVQCGIYVNSVIQFYGDLFIVTNPPEAVHTRYGSFDYRNNTLFGLVDDTPDALVNGTDALVNLKTYLPVNTDSFALYNARDASAGCNNLPLGYFLSYTTPCPARSFNDTVVKHTICQGQSLALNTQSSGDFYKWFPATGLNSATNASPIASPTTTTNYIVSIDSAGCKHTEQVLVAVIPQPKAGNIVATNNICGGANSSITITSGIGNYEPYTYSLNNAPFVSDTLFSNLAEGTYSITIKDTKGCTWQSYPLYIKDTIMVNAVAYAQPTSGIAPFTTQFLATATTGATVFNWYINNQYNSNAWYYNYTFTDSGTYNITLVAYNNIPTCADTATFTIVVLPQDTAGVFIPNVFSPNGDGINDLFEVKIKNASVEVFEIYDRWGVQIIKSGELKITNGGIINWSGRTTSGIECSDGTYFYIIKIKLDEKYNKEGIKEYKGFVTLMR